LLLDCHPRMQLVTGTIYDVMDDLWHFSMVTAMLVIMIAAIGNTFFGHEMQGMHTVTSAISVLFDCVLGNYPDDWYDNLAFGAYFCVFMALGFFLLLNFIVAIILEGYSKVKDNMLRCKTEKSFLEDCFDVWTGCVTRRVSDWPRPATIATALRKMRAERH